MDEISKRNFQTLSEGLKQQRSVNSDQDAKIRALEALVVQQQESINLLRTQIQTMLVRSTGTGPTSR